MSPIAPAGRSDLPLLDALDHRILAELQADASQNNVELARRVHASAPTCLRRVRRLIDTGVIERQVALVAPAAVGASLSVVVEVTLDSQAAEHLDHFQALACAEPSITQCYRVSPGPDFVLMAQLPDMPGYQALAQRLYTASARVRNVRAFFVVERAKFETRMPAMAGLGATAQPMPERANPLA